jgi:hypothetical protein
VSSSGGCRLHWAQARDIIGRTQRARRCREGFTILSFEDDRDRRRKSDTTVHGETPEPPKARKKRGSSPEVGHALRAAYQQAISEDIPPEMLDLLGKLG